MYAEYLILWLVLHNPSVLLGQNGRAIHLLRSTIAFVYAKKTRFILWLPVVGPIAVVVTICLSQIAAISSTTSLASEDWVRALTSLGKTF